MNILHLPLLTAAITATLGLSKIAPDVLPPTPEPTPVSVKFEPLEMTCASSTLPKEARLVTSQVEWNKMQAAIERNHPELACTFPEVDFDKQNVIIAATSAGGCSAPDIERKIDLDRSSGIATYEVTVIQHGLCRMLHLVPLVVTVPKQTDIQEVNLVVTQRMAEGR